MKNKKIGNKILIISIISILFIVAIVSIIANKENVILKTKTASVYKLNASTDEYSGLQLTTSQNAYLNVGNKVKVKITVIGDAIAAIDSILEYDKNIFNEIDEDNITCIDKNWSVDVVENYIDGDGKDISYIVLANKKGEYSRGEIAEIEFTVKNTSIIENIALSDTHVIYNSDDFISPKIECEVGLRTQNCIIMYNKNTTDEVTGMPENQTIEKGSSYTVAQGPSREGCTFLGWNSQADGNGTDYAVGGTFTVNSDFTLYAKWQKNTSKLTIDPKGGVWEATMEQSIRTGAIGSTITIGNPTAPVGNKIIYDPDTGTLSNLVDTQTTTFNRWKGTTNLSGTTYTFVENNETIVAEYTANPITLATPTKEGYEFLGWYNSANKENVGLGGQSYNPNYTQPNAEIRLTAIWDVKKYNVTFKDDDDTIIKTIKVTHGSDATFTGELPTKAAQPGYETKFLKWNNAQNLINVTSDVEVKAVYQTTPIVYTITYYNLKEQDNSQNANEYTIEDENIELVDLPNKGKYIFLGWYESNEDDAEKITSIDVSTLKDIVLYAKWENDSLYYEPKKYEIENNQEKEKIKYLTQIHPNTTLNDLINDSDTNGVIVVTDKDGKVLGKNDKIGTNMSIKITRYDEQINLIAIVMGDLDGDGEATATDLSTVNQTILKESTLEKIAFKAADLDSNKKITATDLSTENQIVLKLIFVKE